MKRDLSTSYLGLKLNAPIVIGACPLTLSPEKVREFAIAGAGAVVLPSLFEEQVVHERLSQGQRTSSEERFVESVRYEQAEDQYNGGVEEYLSSIAELKRSSGLVVIASLNGCTSGEWFHIATDIEAAGADAIEITLETDHIEATADANQTEDRLLTMVSDFCDQISLPVSVKVTFFHSNLANLAWRLTESGASGMVCFAYDPAWDILRNEISATPQWTIHPSSNVAATISGLIRARGCAPDFSIAASGGIRSPEDAVAAFLAGADVAMVTSEIYRAGPEAVAHMVDGLLSYLERNEIESFSDLIQNRPQPRLRAHHAYLPFMEDDSESHLPEKSAIQRRGDRYGHVRP